MPDSPKVGFPLLTGGSDYPVPDDAADAADINAMVLALEAELGVRFVTSGTHPSTPYTNQLIYETDTKTMLAWSGAEWVRLPQALLFQRPDTVTASTGTANINSDGSVTFSGLTSVGNGLIITGLFPDPEGVYEVTLNCNSLVGASGTSGSGFGLVSSAGALRPNISGRRENHSVSPVTSASLAPSNRLEIVTNTATLVSGYRETLRVFDATVPDQRTSVSFEHVGGDTAMTHFTGTAVNVDALEDSGITYLVNGTGTASGRISCVRVG